jgi:cyclopropane fatty-acyl-phospholipid synthase-like methyltransferase
MPVANKFFDAVIGIDSFLYFATDERYLGYLAPFIKPRGYIGIVDIGFTRKVPSVAHAPEYLRPEFAEHWSCVHTLSWWRQHWEKTGLVDVQYAELLPQSDELLRDYIRDRPPAQAEDSNHARITQRQRWADLPVLPGGAQALTAGKWKERYDSRSNAP